MTIIFKPPSLSGPVNEALQAILKNNKAANPSTGQGVMTTLKNAGLRLSYPARRFMADFGISYCQRAVSLFDILPALKDGDSYN